MGRPIATKRSHGVDSASGTLHNGEPSSDGAYPDVIPLLQFEVEPFAADASSTGDVLLLPAAGREGLPIASSSRRLAADGAAVDNS